MDSKHQWLLRTGVGEGSTTQGEHEGIRGLMKPFHTLIMVAVTKLHVFVKLAELYTKKGEFYCL